MLRSIFHTCGVESFTETADMGRLYTSVWERVTHQGPVRDRFHSVHVLPIVVHYHVELRTHRSVSDAAGVRTPDRLDTQFTQLEIWRDTPKYVVSAYKVNHYMVSGNIWC